MNEIMCTLVVLEALATRAAVKEAVLVILIEKLMGKRSDAHYFMTDVAYPICSDIRQPISQNRFPEECVTRFRALWDRLPC